MLSSPLRGGVHSHHMLVVTDNFVSFLGVQPGSCYLLALIIYVNAFQSQLRYKLPQRESIKFSVFLSNL